MREECVSNVDLTESRVFTLLLLIIAVLPTPCFKFSLRGYFTEVGGLVSMIFPSLIEGILSYSIAVGILRHSVGLFSASRLLISSA